MIKELKYNFSFFLFLFVSLLSASEGNVPSQVFRQESEIKLNVPSEDYQSVWIYFQDLFKNQSPYIQKIGADIRTTFSSEKFIDDYFDNSKLEFLEAEHGLRYRQRFYPNEPGHPKNGRQLIQVKLSSRKKKSVVRSEVKFDAMDAMYDHSYLSQHSLFSHLTKSDQQSLLRFLKKLGYDGLSFEKILSITQVRNRVYFKKGDNSFLTITLDDVLASIDKKSKKFFEMEIEINEMLYTFASGAEKKELEFIAQRIKKDLLSRFPSIKQDQTPKYNKAFKLLKVQYKQIFLSNQVLIIGFLICCFLCLLVYLASRNRE